MNFQSEAEVHVYLERQNSSPENVPIFNLTTADDDYSRSQQLRKTRTAKSPAAGAFGDLLAKSLSDQENAPTDNFTKLEDMFPADAPTEVFRERFYVNPLLCDEAVEQPNPNRTSRIVQLKNLAGGLGSLVNLLSQGSSKDTESENNAGAQGRQNENVQVILEQQNGLPKPQKSRGSSNMTTKKVSWDETTVNRASKAESPEEEDDSVPKRRLSLSNLLVLLRSNSFGRRTEIIRDPGSELPVPMPRRKSSADSRRKSSKTTVATDDSKSLLGSKLLKFFAVY